MRKIIRKAGAIALAMCMGMSMAYAWYVVVFSGKLSLSGVSPAIPATNVLKLADQNVGVFSADLALTSNKALYPCTQTSTGWVNDTGENVSSNSSYVIVKSLYLDTNDNTTNSLKISSCTLSGTGASDEISKSIRVMVCKGDDSIILNPTGTNDYTQALSGVNGNNRVISVIIWYEGTDSHNTSANALNSSGSVQVNISFESE